MTTSVTATIELTGTASPKTSRRAFARHYVEMVAAMFLGMGVLVGLEQLYFAVTDTGIDDLSGGLRITLMGAAMTIPMVAWMAHRGHGARRNAEMAATMLVPTVAAAVLTWTGAIGVGAGMAIEHSVMFPAMLAVMLWRYDEYAHVHRADNA